jgi:hypothetical protein
MPQRIRNCVDERVIRIPIGIGGELARSLAAPARLGTFRPDSHSDDSFRPTSGWIPDVSSVGDEAHELLGAGVPVLILDSLISLFTEVGTCQT